MSQLNIQTRDGEVRISVRVKPRSSRSCVLEVRDQALVVSVAAPPVDGEANSELQKTIARWLEVPRASVKIAAGANHRNKVISIANITAAEVLARLPS